MKRNSMKKWVVKEKQVGETPLEVAEAYRKEVGLNNDVSIAYAGRLDPMASGRLLLLLGDECKKQKNYFGLDKKYEFEVLFGVSTDTGDVLGLLTNAKSVQPQEVAQIEGVVKGLEGEQTFPYPRFSSKTVHGKPLHMWTLEGRLDEIEIPTITSHIYSLTCLNTRTISAHKLKQTIFEKINSFPKVTDPKKALGADFRRKEVREQWSEFFENQSNREFIIGRFCCVASSGTYMRTLAEALGKRIGTPALALSIHRTNIGKFYAPFRMWLKHYR